MSKLVPKILLILNLIAARTAQSARSHRSQTKPSPHDSDLLHGWATEEGGRRWKAGKAQAVTVYKREGAAGRRLGGRAAGQGGHRVFMRFLMHVEHSPECS